MVNSRETYIEKINWYKSAIANTNSRYLKRDYQKAIKRMRRELKEYDRLYGNRCRTDFN